MAGPEKPTLPFFLLPHKVFAAITVITVITVSVALRTFHCPRQSIRRRNPGHWLHSIPANALRPHTATDTDLPLSMAGRPITKKTKGRTTAKSTDQRPITKQAKERRPTTKTKEQRQEAFVAACRRSGFDGFELLQILADWYGWQKVVITSAPGITEHTITNAWSQSKTEREYRTGRGSP